MSISSRFAIAVHILIPPVSAEGLVPSLLIAGSVGTNPALIRHLVAQLADAGFVTSQMGVIGGAASVRPADRITSLDISRMVEVPALIALPPNAPNPACEVGREITDVFERTTERAQAVLEVELAVQTIANILSEVGRT